MKADEDEWPAVLPASAKRPPRRRDPNDPNDYDPLDSVLPGDDRSPDGFSEWPGRAS